MYYLSNQEEQQALKFLQKTTEIAKQATCHRDKCGSIIVHNNEIIGVGFNSPPLNNELQRKCNVPKDQYHTKVTDKTCCIHAEQRAIFDALKKNPEKLENARLYFIRLDKENNPTKAGKPYCTICSKSTLDVGIKEFVLWHNEGICVYDTQEYNHLSYQYKE
jgi:deoxycytidylate deaminase